MSYKEMMDDVVRKYGFEAEVTIKFCEMCENSTSEDDRKMCEYKHDELMGYFNPDEDEPCFIGEIDDECGFNPYMGCYDYDC